MKRLRRNPSKKGTVVLEEDMKAHTQLRRIAESITRCVIGLALAILALSFPTLAYGATYYVGTCKPGRADFITIMQAVTTVPAGSIINICPGTYPEQVIIQQALTLQGMSSGDSAGVTIAIPSGGLGALSPSDVAAQVAVVDGGGPVNISGIAIDGTGITSLSPGTTGVASILFDGSTGTLDHIVIQNLSQNFPTLNSSLTEGIVGVSVMDDFSVAPTVTIKNSIVNLPGDGLQLYGILASGDVNLSVTNTSLLLPGTTGFDEGIFDDSTGTGSFNGNNILAPDVGIASLSGPSSTTGNTIIGSRYGVYDASSALNVITGNALVGNIVGIETYNPNDTIKNNQFLTGNPLYVGINFNCTSPAAISGNAFIGMSVALYDIPPGTSLRGTAGTYFGVPTIETLCP
jgi:hypothetical protein